MIDNYSNLGPTSSNSWISPHIHRYRRTLLAIRNSLFRHPQSKTLKEIWKQTCKLGDIKYPSVSPKPEVHSLPRVEARVLHPQLGDGVPGDGEGVAGVDVLLAEGVDVALVEVVVPVVQVVDVAAGAGLRVYSDVEITSRTDS